MVPEETEHIVTDIKKQYNNIDVLVEVNDKYSIIIEDKTFSNVHDDQINEYEKKLKSEGRQNIKCVYYKIVEQAHDEKMAINIKRNDLLDTFSEYIDKTNNVIFRNYFDYLLAIDEDVNGYKNTPINFWREKYNHAYKGFFAHLVQDNIIQIKEDDVVNGKYNWGYVANPNGGIWYLWWFSIKSECLDSCNLFEKYIDELYLEIEDNQIVIKMTGDSQEAQDVRWSLYEFCNKNVEEFKKKTFRKGKHMTVGYVEFDEKNYREKIKTMENLMRSIVGGQYKFETELKDV